MAYTFLDNSLNTIGVLTNKGGQTNDYWGDSITHEIATSQDVLTSVSLSVDKPSVNIDTSGNQKTWNHVIQGLSFNIDGIGRKVNENDYLIYQEGTNGKYYLMAITQVDESAVQSGFHYKTVQGLNAAAYDLSRKTLRAKSFAQIPDNTQEKGTAQNILKYIFEDINWDVRTIGSFGAVDYDIAEGTTAQAVLLDIIGMFEAEVDAYVQLNNWGKGANVFNKNGSIKRIFDFSTSLGKYRGETIRYDKNMVSITKTGARDSMYTKLYVNGNNITIADANKGADFIVDDVANRKYNKLGAVSTPVTYLEGIISNSAIESPTALLAWGKKQLAILNHPRYNYQISATNDDKVQLGDTVIIQDTHASDPIYLKSKVISKSVSLADPVNNSFIVGEFSPIVIGADNGLEDSDQIMQLVNQANQTAINAQNKANENAKKIVDTRTNLEKTIDQKLQEGKDYSNSLNQKQKEAYDKFQAEINKGLEDAQKERDEISKKADDMLTTANSHADDMYNNAVAVAKDEASKALSDANTALYEAKTDLTDGLNKEIADRNKAVSAVNSQAQDYADQAKSDAIEAAKTADGQVRKDFKETTDALSSTISQNKKDSDGKISTAQSTATQALNGLSTKVSQTDYDKKTSDLSTKVNTVTQTANETKNELANVSKTVDSQSAQINTISNTVDGTTQTISDIKTEQGKQSGSIATLKSRADGFDATVTKVNNLAVGGRNLLLDTSKIVTQQGAGADNVNGNFNAAGGTFKFSNSMNTGLFYNRDPKAIYILSYDWSVEGDNPSGQFNPQFTNAPWGFGGIAVKPSETNKSGHSVTKFQTQPRWKDTSAWGIIFRQDHLVGKVTITNMKLEIGTIPTDWTPAPEDLSSATAKAQLTADQATLDLSNYKTDADGRISKAQSDITATSKEVKTKVSQSDYNAKTDDLTTKYGQVKATADAVTTDVSKYKTANDKKVSANTASINTLNNQITSKVSQTDFDKKTGELNGKFTQQKQTVDNISQTVTELQAKANSQGQVNQLFNTEFTPDLQGWSASNHDITYAGVSKSVTIKGSNVLNITHGSNTNWSSYRQQISNFVAGATLSASVYARATSTGWGFAIDSFSADGKRTIVKQVTITTTNTLLKIENVTIPSDADKLYFSFWGNTAGTAVIYKPMLVFDSKVGNYVQGNYNNNSRVSALEVSLDGITQTVQDPKNGLSATNKLASDGNTLAIKAQKDATTAITTANGIQTQVNSNDGDIKSLQSTMTQTAKQITTEVADRKSGDSAVTTQLTNLIDSRVTSVTNGYQSAISQSEDTIMASVSMPNKLVNTEFEPDLEGWTINNPLSGTGNPATIYTSNGYGSSNGLRINAYSYNADDADAYYQVQQSVKVPDNISVASLHIMGFIYAISSNGYAYVNANVVALDRNGKNIGAIVPGRELFNKNKTQTWQESSSTFINMAIPKGTDSLQISIYARGQTSVNISQPMLVFANAFGSYQAGSYNNMGTSTVLELFKDNWALGIADNAGRLISGINGDRSGTVIQGKKLVINSDTTITGKAFINGAVIKNGSIGTAQIGKAAIGSAQIINVDVSKISGNIANFITGNISRLNSHVLYGDTGHLTTVDTGLIINNQDDHLQLASHGQYDVPTKRAQFELLGYANNIDSNMRGSLNYYKNPHNKGTGLGIRFLGNQILAIDEAVATGNLYLSPYASGQVQVVNRDRNGFQDIKASKFVTSSERKYKSEIEDFNDNALELVNNLNVRKYIKNNEDEIGVIADEADERILDKTNTGVDLYSFVSVVAKAVQELSAQVKELQNERPNNY